MLEDAQNWIVDSADIKNAFYQMHIPGWLHAFFALSVVLASEVGVFGENDQPKINLALDSMSVRIVQVRRRMRCRLPEGRVVADFPEVSLQLLDPSKWTVVSFARKTSGF